MSKRVWLWAALGLMAACQRGEAADVRAGKGAEGAEQLSRRVPCGKVVCAAGEVCCNPSCGICTAVDGMCTQQFCNEAPPEAEAGEPLPEPPSLTCDNVRCQAGTHCEMVEAQCDRAPCKPVPACRPDGLIQR